ncbi:histidine phosphatase family protein [Corynebacterium neomassiliense]|uniref:histidine phosphatase family protein n=1 Tax=Corynebacterium neomassiliense TaxID=2079482 RepID=UPI00102FAA5A
MTRLLLIRHGQTTSNVIRALDTALPGASLTALGWDQARAAGERIAVETGGTAPGMYLVSSLALRARQTAAGIVAGAAAYGVDLNTTSPGSPFAGSLTGVPVVAGYGGLSRRNAGADLPEPVLTGDVGIPSDGMPSEEPTPEWTPAAVQDVPRLSGSPQRQLPVIPPEAVPGAVPGISEIPAGRLEMRTDPEAHLVYHRTFADWLGGALDLRVSGALNGREVVGRYLSSLLPMLAAVRSVGSDLAVVSHGAVIRLVAGYLGRVDPGYAVRTDLANTARVELEVPDSLTVPELPTVDAPMLWTGDYLPEIVREPWKVTDWAGLGEPPSLA